MKITSKTSLRQIRNALQEDGFFDAVDHEAEVKAAALRGCLLWTRERLTTTDASRIDVRPSGVKGSGRAGVPGFSY